MARGREDEDEEGKDKRGGPTNRRIVFWNMWEPHDWRFEGIDCPRRQEIFGVCKEKHSRGRVCCQNVLGMWCVVLV